MQLQNKYTFYELSDSNSIYLFWTVQSNCFCKTKQMKLLAISITRQNIPLPKTHIHKNNEETLGLLCLTSQVVATEESRQTRKVSKEEVKKSLDIF